MRDEYHEAIILSLEDQTEQPVRAAIARQLAIQIDRLSPGVVGGAA